MIAINCCNLDKIIDVKSKVNFCVEEYITSFF